MNRYQNDFQQSIGRLFCNTSATPCQLRLNARLTTWYMLQGQEHIAIKREGISELQKTVVEQQKIRIASMAK
jgi:hypothetical protein